MKLLTFLILVTVRMSLIAEVICCCVSYSTECLTYLAKSRDKHDARNEGYTCGQSREEGENHQCIADVHVANVNKLVRDDVVAVMR